MPALPWGRRCHLASLPCLVASSRPSSYCVLFVASLAYGACSRHIWCLCAIPLSSKTWSRSRSSARRVLRSRSRSSRGCSLFSMSRPRSRPEVFSMSLRSSLGSSPTRPPSYWCRCTGGRSRRGASSRLLFSSKSSRARVLAADSQLASFSATLPVRLASALCSLSFWPWRACARPRFS
eukprot:Amastigsp_a843235_22.p2 type:complete len:179 gc:universal Amastigsp_a843235_22:479-1015(+)